MKILSLFLTAAVFAASSDVLREPEFPDCEKKAQIVQVSIASSAGSDKSVSWDVSGLADDLSGQSVWNMFLTHYYQGSSEVNDAGFIMNRAISNGADEVTGPMNPLHPVFGRFAQVTVFALFRKALASGKGLFYDSGNPIEKKDSDVFSGVWLWWSGTPEAVSGNNRSLRRGRVRFNVLGEEVMLEGRHMT